MTNLQLTSQSFSQGDEMPRHFGYKNGNTSPPLTISGIPTEAKYLVLVMDDPDAMGAVGKIWVHWVVWNIGAKTYNFWMDQQKYSTDPENLPRHKEFFFSRNRLNVAISRAQCVAVILFNPNLLLADCKKINEMRLINNFCKLLKYETID